MHIFMYLKYFGFGYCAVRDKQSFFFHLFIYKIYFGVDKIAQCKLPF